MSVIFLAYDSWDVLLLLLWVIFVNVVECLRDGFGLRLECAVLMVEDNVDGSWS